MSMATFSACTQPKPMVNYPRPVVPPVRLQDTVVVVMGSTGTGKSRLSIDLATHFDAEVINSDKMQVYNGLDIVTNKVTDEECRGITHHLLGTIDPEEDFTAHDFVRQTSLAVDEIAQKGRLPIIAGGSNSYIKALIEDDYEFMSKYKFCFLWVDVSMPILHPFLSKRVDRMVDRGLVEEVREFFHPGGDYTHGVRRSIGVPEMDAFFRNEHLVSEGTRAKLLEVAIAQIKANTSILSCNQVQKILMLREKLKWQIHRLDATEAFLKRETNIANETWEQIIESSIKIVDRFFYEAEKIKSKSTINMLSIM